MAGRFLSLEETAQRLGVTVDEVNRLVDRKKLFPMRDGAAIKFKVDDVEAAAGHLGEESSRFDDLSLDIRSGSVIGSGSAAPALSGIEADDLVLDDLAIEDEKDAASVFIDEPLAPGRAAGSGALSLDSLSGGSLSQDSGTLAIDLSDATRLGDASGGSLVVGSGAGLAKGSGATGAGAALSGVLDSGLSLEDDDAALTTLGGSAIDMETGGGLDAGLDDAATMLGSDDFELGGLGGDDESASVVIAADESTESSFFTETMAGASSGFEESSASSMAVATEEGFPGIRMTPDTRFSALQVCGLVCCTLMLLTGGFVALDLVRTIGSPDATKMANPLLDAMSEAFGWR
jgi:excisionase family DNA binding protein